FYQGNYIPWSNNGDFHPWQTGHAYTCNSWMLETRLSFLAPPVAGDIVSFTIAGSFTGSPVTVSHTLSSTDVSFIIANAGFQPGSSTSPICDDLISKINSPAAGSHGVTAGYANTTGWYFTYQSMNRIYLNLSAVNITVTGNYSTSNPNNA